MRRLLYAAILIISMIAVACNSKKQEKVEYPYDMDWHPSIESTDRMVAYYILNNPQKWAYGGEYTTEDLHESANLLTTAGGVIKAIDYGGWRIVENYYVRTACPGWKIIHFEYISILGKKKEGDVYLRSEQL